MKKLALTNLGQKDNLGFINLADYVNDLSGTINQTEHVLEAESIAFAESKFLYHPGGNILISSVVIRTALIGSECLLNDDSEQRAIFSSSISDGGAVIELKGANLGSAGEYSFHIENIVIEGVSRTQNAVGLRIGTIGGTVAQAAVRGYLRNVRTELIGTGVELHGWLNRIDNLWIKHSDVLGMRMDECNANIMDLVFEANEQDFVLTNSYGTVFTRLEMEGSTGTRASTIDGTTGLTIASIYCEDSQKTTPWIDIGITSECRNIKILGGIITGVGGSEYPITCDKVKDAELNVVVVANDNYPLFSISNNSENISSSSITNSSSGYPVIDVNSRIKSVATNVFPNQFMDGLRWGATDALLSNVSLSSDTDNFLTGDCSLKILSDSSTDDNYFQISIKDTNTINSLGTSVGDKTLTLGVWVYVPDDEGQFDVRVFVGNYHSNGASLGTALSNSGELIAGKWNFVYITRGVTLAVAEIRIKFYVNESSINSSGTEYILIDRVVLCEGNATKQVFFGGVVESSINTSIVHNGKLIMKLTSSDAATIIVDTGQTWEIGDLIEYSNPTAGGFLGIVCTTGGAGATSIWKNYGAIVA